VATLFAAPITDVGEMREIILSRLFDQYAEQNGIKATEEEIATFIDNMKRGVKEKGLAAEAELTPAEAAQVDAMRRDMGRSMIRQWKINKALYREYGGRVIYQQFGPEPLDAYREYLEAQQREGTFVIHEMAFEDEFWSDFSDDSKHSFFERGTEASAFEVPTWES